jgi:hypothetical protein
MAHIQIDEIGAHAVLVPQKQRGGSFTDDTLNPYVGCGILRACLQEVSLLAEVQPHR